MGDWVYYISVLKMGDIATRVNVAAEIHKTKSLKDFIQRELDESNHSEKISEYLLNQTQRLFNSLVIGVYGGSPEFYEINIDMENQHYDLGDFSERIRGTLGLLKLDGTENLFALDGQHRVVGIRKSLAENESLRDEEVGTIFVAHNNDEAGIVRTRRLFTTLNKYAKKPSKFEIIALDEDDVIAIITRSLIDDHPLFRNKTGMSKQKRISPQDQHCFTNVISLYDTLDIILRDRRNGWVDFKRVRPETEDLVRKFYERGNHFWELMSAHLPAVREMQENAPANDLAAEYRHKDGGHVVFRPVGLILYAKVIKKFLDDGIELEHAINLLSLVPTQLSEEPWRGVFWNTVRGIMIYSSENQRIAQKMIYCSLGGNLENYRTTEEELKLDLAGIQNKDPNEIHLPKYV